MKSISVLFSLTCIACTVLAQRRQIGGRDTSIRQYPFMAAVAFARQLVGNGAIIAPRWILTSASAVYAPQDALFDVQVGADSFMGSGSWYEVLQIYRHPEFVGWDYNIALIHLKGPIKYSDTVQPIGLATTDTDYIDATMLSYGINEQETQHLREAAYTLSADDECVAFLTDWLAKEMITQHRGYCVRPFRGAQQGQWFNDAGAPVVANNLLYGVFAFAEDEGGINEGSVATRVISFADWIQRTMQAHTF
ncbi:chymotrypsin-1-like [Anopheles stephensi]|uniref:chymotrypsin-1-like n=1 Tax=Anopheles stephensi TaxID=30069 RepID=UPI0016588BEA|nr:chymotrypsin-1-like [Anopheles stephensi]